MINRIQMFLNWSEFDKNPQNRSFPIDKLIFYQKNAKIEKKS